MKIHFVASVDGIIDDYKKIIDVIRNLNCELVTNHYLEITADKIDVESENDTRKFYENAKKWIEQADIVIFEITKSDANISFEASLVFENKKPLIVLYKDGGTVPRSFKVFDDNFVQVVKYNDKNLEDLVSEAISFSSQQTPKRFNLMLSRDRYLYLRERSNKLSIPISAYIRQLIDKDKIK